MRTLPSWSLPLRDWQEQAFIAYLQHNEKDFLTTATPAGGKTTFAAKVAHFRLSAQHVTRLIVVCPTEYLKKQWAVSLARVGIQLDPHFENAMCKPAPDFHGVVVTYQQVGQAPELFRHLCQEPTLVVFDEIHHAGDEKSWGKGLRRAFDMAAFRLSLSGTPFRGDNSTIPFVAYRRGRSKANFSYSYAESLRDRVCRYVFFPQYEGEMRWISREKGKVMDASFRQVLNPRQASERLNTALDLKGKWLPGVLRDAHERLKDIRANGHPDAGGLVIARDQAHAEGIAELLTQLTGDAPALVISDNPDALCEIEAYRSGSSCWIVAVKMVSEGVDIPRLRVLVFATTVQTPLYFRQAFGRIIRVIDGIEEQSGYFYIPSDPTLVAHAQAIMEERDHVLRIDLSTNRKARSSGSGSRTPTAFVPLQATPQANGFIFNKQEYSEALRTEAVELCRTFGQYVPPEVAVCLLAYARQNPAPNSVATPPEPSDPLFVQHRTLRDQINSLAVRYALANGLEIRDVHKQWLERGGKRHDEATIADLEAKYRWLIQMLGGQVQ